MGTALPAALKQVFDSSEAPPQARGAIQDIAYRTLRRLAHADAALATLTDKPPTPVELQNLLACALALLISDPVDVDLPYSAFTLVDQAVVASAMHPKLIPARGLINAVLRRYLREQTALDSRLRETESVRWNYPKWWIDATRAAYPEPWVEVLDNGNRMPPLTLRVNRRRTTVPAYLDQLAAVGMTAQQVGPSAIRLEQAVNVARIPGFAQGLVSVQDAAAQLAAPLLDLQAGMRVLDACAAPGGKTCHMLELADIVVTAIDSDANRLARVSENLDRLGLQAKLIRADAADDDWWDGVPFDRILADVPCTASGIVRRHPDIRWLRRPEDAEKLATVSSKILDKLWCKLQPNGKLLFVTCSIWPQESEQQAQAFAKRTGAMRLAAPGQLLPVSHAEQDHDGLFYALFQKPEQ